MGPVLVVTERRTRARRVRGVFDPGPASSPGRPSARFQPSARPNHGRFTTRDLVFGDSRHPLSLNQYAYGADNPISMWDPDGCPARTPLIGPLLICHAVRSRTMTTFTKEGDRYSKDATTSPPGAGPALTTGRSAAEAPGDLSAI